MKRTIDQRLTALEQRALGRDRYGLIIRLWDEGQPQITDGAEPHVTYSTGGWIRYEDYRPDGTPRLQPGDDEPDDCRFLLVKPAGR